jgi:hypothetical protein
MGRTRPGREVGSVARPSMGSAPSRWSGARRSVLGLSLLALTTAAQTACLVDVHQVSDPRAAFRQARADAEKVQGRSGPAHHLNVLVYDPDDKTLVKVSLPLWLCRKIDKGVDWDVDASDRSEGDRDGAERVRRAVKRHVRLEDIEKAGLGVLAEVEDDDGSQVLIWLK